MERKLAAIIAGDANGSMETLLSLVGDTICATTGADKTKAHFYGRRMPRNGQKKTPKSRS